MKIFKRQYDVALNDVKGSENILTEQFYDRFKCKLFRYIVALDESEYILDRLGMPMMTEKSQEEYDDFVRKIRCDVDNGEMHIFDCGYGVGDAELEWHISYYAQEDGKIVGVMQIETYVRIDRM